MVDAICVGSCCVDVLVYGMPEKLDFNHEVIQTRGNKLWIGGDALNEALVLTRLGRKVKLMCGLGNDAAADFIELMLNKNGVDTSLCPRDADHGSGVTVVMVKEDGQRNFLAEPENLSLSLCDNTLQLPEAKIITMGSLYLPPFDDIDTALLVARQAKEMGAFLCADVSVDENSSLEYYHELWPYVDYFFPNEDEASMLTGEKNVEKMADQLLRCGIKNVVIKIGKKGCLLKDQEKSLVVPAFLTDVVDTTGAGDNFLAGFAAGLLEGKTKEECCRYANAAASIAVRYQGASTGIRSMKQLKEILCGKEKHN